MLKEGRVRGFYGSREEHLQKDTRKKTIEKYIGKIYNERLSITKAYYVIILYKLFMLTLYPDPPLSNAWSAYLAKN